MAKSPTVVRQGNLVRSSTWAGIRSGDPVVVDGVKERRQSWVFVAHVRNEVTNEDWVEVRGGRAGEAKGRSFRTELIYPSGAKKGSRLVGLPLVVAPQLALYEHPGSTKRSSAPRRLIAE